MTALRRYNRWLRLAKVDKKSYQVEGVRWMLEREPRGGGILADEMGLGKTFQMMGLIAADPKKTLVVVPPALLDQWRDVLTKFLEPPAFFHGLKKDTDFSQSTIVLTTYNMLSRDPIKSREWSRVIYDEAHHLRNKNSNKFKSAEALSAKISWMVTGTPIQNRKSDLYSLCEILKIPKSEIMDACLRRTKKDVGLKLPEMVIHEEYLDWETKTEENFALDIHSLLSLSAVNGRNVNAIIRALDATTGHGFTRILRARQMCIMPQLLNLKSWIEQGWIDENAVTFLETMSTTKIDAVCRTILKRNNGRKKLIFCHFRKEIDEIAERLNHLKVGVIDGRTKKKERYNILNSSAFSKELCNEITDKLVPGQGADFAFKQISSFIDYDVVILQIQTCCEGLNLQQFQEVYFTTPHWNPAVEDQAMARCHRLGQKETVDVFKFYMQFSGSAVTMDEYCSLVQKEKRKLHF